MLADDILDDIIDNIMVMTAVASHPYLSLPVSNQNVARAARAAQEAETVKSAETSPFSLKEVREWRGRSRSHRMLSEEIEDEGELRSPGSDAFDEPMVTMVSNVSMETWTDISPLTSPW